MNDRKICEDIYNWALEVHDSLGGGFNETVHQNGLAIEFREQKIPYLKEVNIEIFYKGHSIGVDRPDFVLLPTKRRGWNLNKPIVLEIKVTSKISDDNRQQLKTYLKSLPQNKNTELSGVRSGILLRWAKSDEFGPDGDKEDTPQVAVELELWTFNTKMGRIKRKLRLPEIVEGE